MGNWAEAKYTIDETINGTVNGIYPQIEETQNMISDASTTLHASDRIYTLSAEMQYIHRYANPNWVQILEITGRGLLHEFIINRSVSAISSDYNRYTSCGYILEIDNVNVLIDEPPSLTGVYNGYSGIIVASNTYGSGMFSMNSFLTGTSAYNFKASNPNVPVIPRIGGVSYESGNPGTVILPHEMRYNSFVRLHTRYTADQSTYVTSTATANIQVNAFYTPD